jgi:RNA-binding protein
VDELSGRQRRFLRGLGNQLEATVYVGREGISEPLVRALDEAFSNHELVKVRIERGCPLDRKDAGPRLAEAASAHLVQILGQTVLLFRRDPEKPRIELPE